MDTLDTIENLTPTPAERRARRADRRLEVRADGGSGRGLVPCSREPLALVGHPTPRSTVRRESRVEHNGRDNLNITVAAPRSAISLYHLEIYYRSPIDGTHWLPNKEMTKLWEVGDETSTISYIFRRLYPSEIYYR